MDFSNLKEQVSNLTLYDLKAGVRKVQNAVMNYTEMEAKVRSYSPASSVPPRVPGLRTPCGRIP
ncbi:epsin-3, clathrin recruitment and traffic between the Golgi and endosome [Aspergillus niger]|nr:epsin-3, clathrin recruitment and traffic between the Golgi and endosome [Aspergillus niger]GKZ97190.1 epsin-3, clathrin recruitment and traffic between the Golgi and endosome [Aspergillus niger]GLA13869.1 epsin-3, clathrin recruitment and traffic between the Golgi and endosome [Aspergillus niger]GLA37266.1 epsin-3, clathrin recruitment and traffic between the Golgi and endosome [Aspergillus niger]